MTVGLGRMVLGSFHNYINKCLHPAILQEEVVRLVTAEGLNGTVSQHSHIHTLVARLQFVTGDDLQTDLEAIASEELYQEQVELVEYTSTTNTGQVVVLGNNITTNSNPEPPIFLLDAKDLYQ